jgi:hypothetical protein
MLSCTLFSCLESAVSIPSAGAVLGAVPAAMPKVVSWSKLPFSRALSSLNSADGVFALASSSLQCDTERVNAYTRQSVKLHGVAYLRLASLESADCRNVHTASDTLTKVDSNRCRPVPSLVAALTL